ncbi:MAG TPA: glycosyltransferase family 4 protein, partial [Gemmataceae bacterium]|nr:glycosyltransferase family 4 protein [Gemmataceae bacterium]
MTRWAILTGEYPPQPGGVSDYTQLIATELAAAGDSVRVYAPPLPGSTPARAGVEVVQLPDHFGPRSLLSLDRMLSARPPDRILIQYVPHAFGWKGMNLPFAAWVAARARVIAPVWMMFHEVAFPFAWRPAKYALLGGATRIMARLVAGAAARVFVSIPFWVGILRRFCPRAKRAEWLPVPGVVGAEASPDKVAAVRRGFPPGVELVGHFGTFGGLIADVLEPAARDLLHRRPRAHLLLVGRNSDQFLRRFADLAGRVSATGELPPDDVAAHLRACDVLLQPYPDGISSRRTSAM